MKPRQQTSCQSQRALQTSQAKKRGLIEGTRLQALPTKQGAESAQRFRPQDSGAREAYALLFYGA